MITDILLRNKNSFHKLFPFELQKEKVFLFDFSVDNQELCDVNLSDVSELSKYVNNKLAQNNKPIGFGGYLENRLIYKRSNHFGQGENARSIHLGIDIWQKARTPIFAFMNSKVHSFKINDNFGDYGPTIILEHELENLKFYTLYGHLSKYSLEGLYEGKIIKKGEKFAEFGNEAENGNWPPHLHFQIITDMQGKKGDFYGVCSPNELEKFKQICPNPNLILNYG